MSRLTVELISKVISIDYLQDFYTLLNKIESIK